MPKSFASNERYFEIQGRNYDDGTLHIQGRGEYVNRPYGVAVSLTIPAELRTWIGKQDHTLNSLAGDSKAKYVPMQARIRDGVVHIQVAGSNLNREYGASFDVEGAEDLVRYLESLKVEEAEEDEEVESDGVVTLS